MYGALIFDYFSIIILIFSGCVRKPKHLVPSNEDDDVARERQRIYSDRENQSGDVLRMVDLVKV